MDGHHMGAVVIDPGSGKNYDDYVKTQVSPKVKPAVVKRDAPKVVVQTSQQHKDLTAGKKQREQTAIA